MLGDSSDTFKSYYIHKIKKVFKRVFIKIKIFLKLVIECLKFFAMLNNKIKTLFMKIS